MTSHRLRFQQATPPTPTPSWTACGLDSDPPPPSPNQNKQKVSLEPPPPPPPTIHLSRCSRALLRHHHDVTDLPPPPEPGEGGRRGNRDKHDEKIKDFCGTEAKTERTLDFCGNFRFLLLLLFFFFRALKRRRRSDGHGRLHPFDALIQTTALNSYKIQANSRGGVLRGASAKWK